MVRVTEEVVAHVARLARLQLTDEERRLFARQLDEVLAHARSLEVLDLDQVEVWSSAPDAGVLRPDQDRPGLPDGRALDAAPDSADRLFRVPRVLPG